VRRAHPALTRGAYRPIVAESDLLLYTRELDGERILVALNLGDEPASLGFSHPLQGRVLVSSLPDRDGEIIDGRVELRPLGGLVVALSGTGAVTPGKP
jgi:alpha-glucosidase